MKDDGVSTQVGIILILAIVSLAVALIFSGYRGITDSLIASNHEKELRNSIVLLHTNIEKVVFEGVSVRSTELKTYEGFFAIENNSYVIINNSVTYVGSIYYKGNAEFSIENGGVFANFSGSKLVLIDPPVLSSGNVTIFPLIQLTGSGSTSGKGVLRVRVDSLGGGVFESENRTVQIVSKYAPLWKEILEKENFRILQSNYTYVKAEAPGKLLVKTALLKVEFLR